VLEEIYKLLRGGAARRSFELLLESRLMTELMPSYVDLYRKLSPGGLSGPASKTRPGEPSRVMWNLLEALDEYTSATSQVASNGVLLAVLFAPLLDEQWMTASRQGLDRLIDDLMGPVCVSLGVARRDRELARQILMAHRRMVESLTRKKRRPSLVQRQYFHDALVFLGLTVKARGGDGSELGHWQRLAAVTQPLRIESGDEFDSGPRRKRRRRTRHGGGTDGRRHSPEPGTP
jgi:poly(A) polymerase